MLEKGHLSSALDNLYLVCERPISPWHVSLTLWDTVEQNQQDSWERGEHDTKRGRTRRGGWRKKRSRGEPGGPIDFRASLVLFWSLNCCPHSTFLSTLSPLRVPPCQVVGFVHAYRATAVGGWVGGLGRMEVEVLTVPVGDWIICDTVSPFTPAQPFLNPLLCTDWQRPNVLQLRHSKLPPAPPPALDDTQAVKLMLGFFDLAFMTSCIAAVLLRSTIRHESGTDCLWVNLVSFSKCHRWHPVKSVLNSNGKIKSLMHAQGDISHLRLFSNKKFVSSETVHTYLLKVCVPNMMRLSLNTLFKMLCKCWINMSLVTALFVCSHGCGVSSGFILRLFASDIDNYFFFL